MEQKSLARMLKIIIIGAAVCGLVVYFLIIPSYGRSLVDSYPEFANRFWPWMIFIWMTAIPCYVVLFLGWRIATYIGKDKSFSNENAMYLKWIAWLASVDVMFFFIGNLILLFTNMSHPGVTLMSLIVAFIGISVAVASAILSHLVKKAAALQEQSDYTI